MFKLKTIKERLQSLVYASRGLSVLIRKEDSFKFQVFFSVLFVFLGLYFQISTSEWLAQLGMTALVLTAEGLNSALEELANYIQPKHDEAIGKVKDLAAGAVLVSGFFAFIIGLIIYIPFVLDLI